MEISFVSVSAVASTGASDDVTVVAPASIQNGDLLLAFYESYNAGSNTGVPVTITDFTTLCEEFDQGGGDRTVAIMHKIASGESGNYAITASASDNAGDTAACMMVLRGVDQTTPIDVAYVEASHHKEEQNTTTPTPQPITVVTEGAWSIVFAVNVFGNPVTASVQPTGYTERVDQPGAPAGNAFNISTKPTTLAGNPETPGIVTFTDGNAAHDNTLFTIAVRPARVGLPSFHGANRGIMRGVARGVG